MAVDTHEILFRRFLDDGDENALAAVVRRCSPRLRSFAMRFALSADLVEELVHETMVTAVQRSAAYDASQPLLPWLQGILTRKIANHVRSEARRQRHQQAWALDRSASADSPIDAAAGSELHALLRRAIASVPERYRVALELHVLEGLTPREVSKRLGRLQATTRVHLFRGLRELRRRLPPGLTPALLALLLATAVPGQRTGARPRPWWGRGSARAISFGAVAALVVVALAVVPFSGTFEPAPRGAAVGPGDPAGDAAGDPRSDATPRTAEAAVDARFPVPMPAASKAAGNGLVVQVRDRDGEAVPGVGVWVEPVSGEDPLAARRRGVTAIDGSVRFDGLVGSSVRLRSDRGHERSLDLARDAGVVQLVANGLTVRGIVIGRDGEPAAGAAVWLAAVDDAFGGGVVTRTDAAGRFALGAMPRVAIVAAMAPHAVAPPRPCARDGGELRLRLAPAGAVSGTLRDPAGRPCADVAVTAGAAPEFAAVGLPDGVEMQAAPTATVRTDVRGRFGPLWLPPGEHEIYARVRGRQAVAKSVTITADETVELALTMREARTLRGRVIDSTGAALASAEVAYRGPGRDQVVGLQVAADGTFRFDLPAGCGVVCARAPGHAARRVVLDGGAGPQDPLVIELPIEPRFVAELAFPDGAPAAAWSVRCQTSTRSALIPSVEEAVTDEDGRCDLREREGPVRLRVRAAGDPVWHDVEPGSIRTTSTGVAVTVPERWRPTAGLRGRCLGVGDAPIPFGRVYLRCDTDVFWECASTDRSGHFAVPRLVPGTYSVFVESTDPTQPAVRNDHVVLTAGVPADVVLRAGPSGLVRYRLRRSDGRPIAGAVVTVVSAPAPRRYARAESVTGELRVPVGSFRLYAMGEDFAWVNGVPFEVEEGEATELDLEVEAVTRRALALKADEAFGHEVLHVSLRRRRDGRLFGEFTVLRDAPPSVMAFLPVGTFDLDVQAESGAGWRGEVVVGSLARRHAAAVVELRRVR